MQHHPWTLKFELAQFTPAEAEQMTSATPAMQRDWRHRGFLPRYEKHARFTIFDLVQLYVMKAYANHGRGPSQSAEHAPKVVASVIRSGLMYEDRSWGDAPYSDVFSSIPRYSRRPHPHEIFDRDLVEKGMRAPDWLSQQSLSDHEVREWFALELLSSAGCEFKQYGSNAIWWPNHQWEIADYDGIMNSNAYDRTDPKFDGAALVIDLDQVARILAARAPRPWISISFESFEVPGDAISGRVLVTGQEARPISDAA